MLPVQLDLTFWLKLTRNGATAKKSLPKIIEGSGQNNRVINSHTALSSLNLTKHKQLLGCAANNFLLQRGFSFRSEIPQYFQAD